MIIIWYIVIIDCSEIWARAWGPRVCLRMAATSIYSIFQQHSSKHDPILSVSEYGFVYIRHQLISAIELSTGT